MRLRQAVQELQENRKEIAGQSSLKRLRRILKFLLIGFFIGRDAERRISELTERNDLIIKGIRKHFEELENLNQQIREIANSRAYPTLDDEKQITAKIRTIEKDIAFLEANKLLEESFFSEKKEFIAKLLRTFSNNVKNSIGKRKRRLSKQIEEIMDSGTYLIHEEKKRHIKAIKEFEEYLEQWNKSKILQQEFISEKSNELREYRRTLLDYNQEFVKQRKKDYSYLWKKGLLSLDDEQQTAIVTDDKHNLVVAAAGSGKTEVLITRIAYLIARKPDGIDPNRILAIAYQRKAREEIEQRLHDRYNIGSVNVKTFHKLGKDILEQVEREFRHTDIIDQNKKREIIRKIFKQKIENEPDYYKLFLDFVKTLHDKETREDVETKDETLRYARERPYFSINRKRVNSRAEKEILDFFLTTQLNGKSIEVKYEPDLDGFRPDFYLPEYDLYIEHWALNEKGEVPEWFSQSTEEYKKAMEMKKKWFAEHDKLLVETFTYEYDESYPDKFIDLLKKRLIDKLRTRNDCDLELALKTYDEIVEIAWQSYRTPIEDIVNFITTAKTYGLKPEKIKNRLHELKWTRKQLAFGNLALPVYYVYEEVLQEHEKIDFEDMINRAIDELDDNPTLQADVYDHMLIDEYQDISKQRCKLIEKLLERNPKCKLFCVGDDWQSIMGFSGSNLNFFVNFKEYFENPAVTEISTNYRSVKTIVDAGADLIKNNTSCQIQKPTMSDRKDVNPIKVLRSPHKEKYEWNYHHQTAEDCIGRIIDYIEKGYSPREIMVLSRCMRTRFGRGYRFIANVRAFIEKAKENGIRLAYDNVGAQNKVRLLTAHKSKGLEAKVIFLLNVTKGPYGFPCEIEDPSIYESARENYPPQDQKEEERRLFYVAITRAMEDLYVYTWEPAMSEFLEEIAGYTAEERLSY